MAERSDEAFIIVREFMTRGLGLTGLPLLVYARIYGFCESGSPYFESKAHLGKILGVDTRSVVRAVRKLEEAGLVFEVGRQELSKGRETKVYRIDFEAARRAKGAIEGAGQSTHGEMPSDDRGPRPCRLLHPPQRRPQRRPRHPPQHPPQHPPRRPPRPPPTPPKART